MKFLSFKDIDFLKDGSQRLEEFKFLMSTLDLAADLQGLLFRDMTDLQCQSECICLMLWLVF